MLEHNLGNILLMSEQKILTFHNLEQ